MKYKLFAFILVVALAACKKETPQNNTSTVIVAPDIIVVHSNTDGFGSSTKPLTGTPYVFPSNISIDGNITSSEGICLGGNNYNCHLDGTLQLYMLMTNDSNVQTTITLPAGLVIPSYDTTIQGAIIVQPDTIIIPASSTMCVNFSASV